MFILKFHVSERGNSLSRHQTASCVANLTHIPHGENLSHHHSSCLGLRQDQEENTLTLTTYLLYLGNEFHSSKIFDRKKIEGSPARNT